MDDRFQTVGTANGRHHETLSRLLISSGTLVPAVCEHRYGDVTGRAEEDDDAIIKPHRHPQPRSQESTPIHGIDGALSRARRGSHSNIRPSGCRPVESGMRPSLMRVNSLYAQRIYRNKSASYTQVGAHSRLSRNHYFGSSCMCHCIWFARPAVTKNRHPLLILNPYATPRAK